MSWLYGFISLCLCFVSSVFAAEYMQDNFLLMAKGIYRQQNMDGGATGATKGAVIQMSLDGSQLYTYALTGVKSPTAVDYDPKRKQIFWVDKGLATINSVFLNGTGEKVIYKLPLSSSPEGIAVDPMAQLIFYTDGFKDTINLLSYDGTNHKLLFQNALKPRTIQLDPDRFTIYWTDWGAGTIERGSYNGDARTRQVLISRTDSYINGLALDLTEHKMYWTDAKRDRVETATMDGNNATILVDISGDTKDGLPNQPLPNTNTTSHFYGIAVDGSYIYVSDWANKQIKRAKKDGSEFEALPHSDLPVVNEMIVFQQRRYQYGPTTPCNAQNNLCSNLCIPVLSNPSTVCECPDDKRLNDIDMKTCLDGVHVNGPSFIWTEFNTHQTSYTRGVPGEPMDYLRTVNFHPWTVAHPGWEMTSVDFDYENNVLYMVDTIDRYILRMTVNGSFVVTSVYYGISSQVHGISYDWLSGSVYWADGLYNSIMVARVETNTKDVKALINTELDRPYSVAVYPQKGLLFWTDNGAVDKIESATLSGKDRKTLLDSSNKALAHPTGIAVEYKSERIFWTNRHSLYSMSIDGSNVKEHFSYTSTQTNFVDVSVYQNFVFISDQGTVVGKPRIWFHDTTGKLTGLHLTLPGAPGGTVMYSKDRQPSLPSGCPAKKCQQICVTGAGSGATCLCRDGYILQGDGKSCEEDENAVGTPNYVYSLGEEICTIPVQDALGPDPVRPHDYCAFGLKDPKYEFHALAYHFGEGDIFFSETKDTVKSIRRANLKIKTDNIPVMLGVGTVKGVAVNYLSSDVYWTDYSYNMIMMIKTDGTYPKLLLTDLAFPVGIVVDALNDKIYWTERGMQKFSRVAGIRSANLDGGEVNLVLQLPYVTDVPDGLALDPDDNRLFYLDTKKNKIFSIDMRGGDKIAYTPAATLRFPDLIIQDLALYNDFLSFTATFNGTASGLILTPKAVGGSSTNELIHHTSGKALDVIAFSQENQPKDTPMRECGRRNGGCEQLCFQRGDAYSCGCVDGMVLNADEITCKSETLLEDNFLLIADDYKHTIYQTDLHATRLSALKLPPTDRPIALDYDFKTNMVYWCDFGRGFIYRMSLDGSKISTVRANVKGSRVDGLAFDSESRLLYYTDMGLNLIGVMNPTGTFGKVLADDVINPRAIVLHSQKGHMYYTERNVKLDEPTGKIMRRDMDGLDATEIVTNLYYPNGLTLDIVNQKIYWVDATTEKLGVASFDGSDRRDDILTADMHGHGDPFAVAMAGNYLYWTDWNDRGLYKTDRQASSWNTLQANVLLGPNDVKYYSKAMLGTNACSTNNGDCSHFCIPTPIGRVCKCEGEDPEDGKNCDGVAACPSNIPNGKFDPSCTYRVSSTDLCPYSCDDGYGRVSSGPLMCLPGGSWNLDLEDLCTLDSCGILLTGSNVKVQGDCPSPAAIGVTCLHACEYGYKQAGGNQKRLCQADQKWSGSPLQCVRINMTRCLPLRSSQYTYADPAECETQYQAPNTVCYQFCEDGTEKISGDTDRACHESTTGYGWDGTPLQCARTAAVKSNSNKNETPLIAGIAISTLVLVALIIAGTIYFCRIRSNRQKHGHYRGHRNIPDGTSTVSAPPSVAPSMASGSVAAMSVLSSPRYDVRNQQIDLGGGVAYDNPAYASTAQMAAMANRAPSGKKMIPHDMRSNYSDDRSSHTSGRTAFSNPMSGMSGQRSVKSMRR